MVAARGAFCKVDCDGNIVQYGACGISFGNRIYAGSRLDIKRVHHVVNAKPQPNVGDMFQKFIDAFVFYDGKERVVG